jgi:hypothetical protein
MRSILLIGVLCAGCSTSGLTTPTALAPALPATTPASIRLTAASRQDRAVDLAATVLTADGRLISNVTVSFSASSGTVAPIEVQTDAAGIARSILTPDAANTVAHVQAGALHASVDVLSAAPIPPTPPTPAPPPAPPPAPSDPPAPPLTVALLVTPSPAGSATTFGLATQAISRAEWNFGDGATATTTTPNVSHVYQSVGTYSVSVTVTDTRGRMVSTAATVTIATLPSPPSQAGLNITLTPSATSVPRGWTLSFTATVNNLTSGETDFVYQWDLDGDAAGVFEGTSTIPTRTSAPYMTAGFTTAHVVVVSRSSGRVGMGGVTFVITN